MPSKKIVQGLFKFCKYTFVNIWKGGQAKKMCQYFWRCVSILSLIFEKGDKEKNVSGFLKICKYTFFNIWKRRQASKNIVLCFFKISKHTFLLIFEKEDKQKVLLDIFQICKYTFFNISKRGIAKKLS